MKLALATDHAGYEMKEQIKEYFHNKEYTIEDFGTHSKESVDYPDMIHPLSLYIEQNSDAIGIILCGSGQGAMITANKHQHIRAALPWTVEIAKLSREHNNANIISIASLFISYELAIKMIEVFLETSFEGGRHETRVNKISCY